MKHGREDGPPGGAKSNREARKQRIFLVDDHPILRNGLTQIIACEPDMEVCGEAESARAAVALIARARPDLVLIDISLRDVNGIELTKELHHRFPSLCLVVLSMHEESLYAERALRAGARGYVMKDANATALLEAMRKALAGGIGISEAMSTRLLNRCTGTARNEGRAFGIDTLSDRELEVFECIGRGLTTRAIAAQLGISAKTVETHRTHVRHKLQARSAAELMHLAARWLEDGRPRD